MYLRADGFKHSRVLEHGATFHNLLSLRLVYSLSLSSLRVPTSDIAPPWIAGYVSVPDLRALSASREGSKEGSCNESLLLGINAAKTL